MLSAVMRRVGLVLWLLSHVVTTLDVNDCSCGFFDADTGQIMTDAIILYFNETYDIGSDDSAFEPQEYINKYERGWNSVYRQGATAAHLANVEVPGSAVYRQAALQLLVSPPVANHLVVGGGLTTKRRDIRYGVFDALVLGPQPWMGGSAMSMEFVFNETESWEVRLANTNNASIAYMSMLTGGEYPDRSIGLNYSTLLNGELQNHTSSPWDFVRLNVYWNPSSIEFFYNGVSGRRVLQAESKKVPKFPGPITFKHWSVGDSYTMQGPPTLDSSAYIGWIRIFFNSSLTSSVDRSRFDTECAQEMACSVADTALRGSTNYSIEATKEWRQGSPIYKLRHWAVATICICNITIVILTIHSVARRKIQAPKKMLVIGNPATTLGSTPRYSGVETATGSVYSRQTDSMSLKERSKDSTAIVTVEEIPSLSTQSSRTAVEIDDDGSQRIRRAVVRVLETEEPRKSHDSSTDTTLSVSLEIRIAEAQRLISKSSLVKETKESASQELSPAPALQKARIDYLAGINTMCALFVTAQHFTLTFTPAVVMSPSPENTHYASDEWARKTIFPFLLNEIWLGLFFTTSCRFLVEKYLETGDLKHIASKAIGRVPRLMIPVTGMILFEYFLMDCGVLNWLVYLPSITWSPWPYTTVYTNFWLCVDRILELAFLVSHGFPQIVFNYCTGVLWTIPPTIEGSWTTLLGAIVAREIRTPSKRFAYYGFCIVVNWYALSWGAYFWAGLMLSDMDITYGYRKVLASRKKTRVAIVIICSLAALAMDSVDLIFIVTGIDILSRLNNIHPDVQTGLPLGETPRGGSPQYYMPRLTGLIFSITLQVAVENSTLLQSVVANKAFMKIFPHTFTMYLVHGLIWWSLGSWICVHLSALGVPYWANMLATAAACYSVLFASLPILTPPLEMLGKSLTQAIWETAHEPALRRMPTLHPFTRDTIVECGPQKPQIRKL